MKGRPKLTADAERQREALGLAVVLLREALGWNQKQLAQRLDMDASYLAKVENGRRPDSALLALRHLVAELVARIAAADPAGDLDQPPPRSSVGRGHTPKVLHQ